jgi:NADPH-dependent 7-cyano-7-deazaguanine reductase QueF
VVSIRYTPKETVLEVASLRDYIDSYVGGRGEIRSMEAMIQQIAADCRNALEVAVEVTADLVIAPEQQMVVRATAEHRARGHTMRF